MSSYEETTPYTELHDPKDSKSKRWIASTGKCPDCGSWNGHALDCEKVNFKDLYELVKKSQRWEEHYRKLADRYWTMLCQRAGKVSILKHENNKLRKANDRLRKQLSELKTVAKYSLSRQGNLQPGYYELKETLERIK